MRTHRNSNTEILEQKLCFIYKLQIWFVGLILIYELNK